MNILIHFLAMMNGDFEYVENGLSAFQLNLLERCTGIEEVSQLGSNLELKPVIFLKASLPKLRL